MKKEFNGHESNCLFCLYYDVGMIFQSYSMEYIVKKVTVHCFAITTSIKELVLWLDDIITITITVIVIGIYFQRKHFVFPCFYFKNA